jgi:hypothetical protein
MNIRYKMPNHCWNTLTIIGHKEDLDEIRENKLSFSYYCPLPDTLTDAEKHCWRCDNWGTKWEAYDVSITEYDKDMENVFECSFTTAWSPPIPFLTTLLKRYPRSWMKLLWKTEDDVAGVFVQHNNKYNEPVITNVRWNEAVPMLTSDGKIYIPEDITD